MFAQSRIMTLKKMVRMYHVSGPPRTKLSQGDRNLAFGVFHVLFLSLPCYITYKIPQWAKAKKGA